MRPLIKNRSGNIGQSARSIVTRRSPFTPTSQWPDPTGIGWTASAIFNPSLIRHDQPTTEHGYRAAGELLDLDPRPTALVAFNDKAAVGALRATAERGLSVPRDVSIAGFDDLDLSRATTPQLTTVRQPLQEMGRMAVSLLIRLLDRHALEALHVELATTLTPRASTAPPPDLS